MCCSPCCVQIIPANSEPKCNSVFLFPGIFWKTSRPSRSDNTSWRCCTDWSSTSARPNADDGRLGGFRSACVTQLASALKSPMASGPHCPGCLKPYWLACSRFAWWSYWWSRRVSPEDQSVSPRRHGLFSIKLIQSWLRIYTPTDRSAAFFFNLNLNFTLIPHTEPFWRILKTLSVRMLVAEKTVVITAETSKWNRKLVQ